MATPINTPLTGEIWHLSIDDLLAPLPAKPRLGGKGPFVINLSASTAPISQPTKGVIGAPHAHVYQIQRTEDRRMRYRLRLGPFSTEDEADAVLEKVRDLYPSALTATADADDLRALDSLRAKIDAQQSAAETPVEKAPATRPQNDAWSAAPPPVPVSPAIPVLTAVAATIEPRAANPAPVRPAPAPHPSPRSSAPSLETTQTVRALTPLELQDQVAMRWYVIQLSLSAEPFDPDNLPNLDIFSEYRLYSVAGLDQGRILHALRLGFFSEEIAAAAVASYLAAFYENSTVKRVSAAERERFADQRVEARKDVGATGKHAVIEITNERVIRETRTAVAPLASVTAAAPGLAVAPGSAYRSFVQRIGGYKPR